MRILKDGTRESKLEGFRYPKLFGCALLTHSFPFIAGLGVARATTSLLHIDSWYRPLCDAQRRIHNTLYLHTRDSVELG
jgi:hypothetical protein